MAKQPDVLLRLPRVKQRTGLGRSTIYEQISQGLFPKPVKISVRAVAWRESQIDQWIEQRILAADSEAGI